MQGGERLFIYDQFSLDCGWETRVRRETTYFWALHPTRGESFECQRIWKWESSDEWNLGQKVSTAYFFLASLSPSFKFLLHQSFSGHFGFSFNQRFFSSFIFGTGAGRDVGTGSSENRWDQFGFIFKGGKRGKEVSRGPFIANSIPFSTLNSFLTSTPYRAQVSRKLWDSFFFTKQASFILLGKPIEIESKPIEPTNPSTSFEQR